MASTTVNAFMGGYISILLWISAYGTYMAIASFTSYLLLRCGKECKGRRLILTYTVVMTVLTTSWVFASAYSSARELAGVRDPNVAYAPATLVAEVASTLQVLASDGALLYRAWVLWNGDMRVMGPLLFLYVFQVGSSIMRCLFCFIPSMAMVLALVEMATLATTLALNLFTTLAIAGYMLAVRRRKHVYGSTIHRAMATTALLAVSAAVYTFLGGISALYEFRVLGAAAPIAALWQIFAFISPSLIILRVVVGVSFENGDYGTESEQALRSFGTPPAPPLFSGRLSIADAYDEKTSPARSRPAMLDNV